MIYISIPPRLGVYKTAQQGVDLILLFVEVAKHPSRQQCVGSMLDWSGFFLNSRCQVAATALYE